MFLKEFKQNDVFKNTIKTFPRFEFKIYKNNIYLNNSLSGFSSIGNINPNNDVQNDYYYYSPKNSSGDFPRAVSLNSFKSSKYGDKFEVRYPLTASIDVKYYPASAQTVPERLPIYALENSLNRNKFFSPHYSYSSSLGNKFSQSINLISIPSIFFGSSISKGTVELNFNYSGSAVSTIKDTKLNGELLVTSGIKSGSVAGVVLYEQGFIVLTGSWDLGISETPASWLDWGAEKINSGTNEVKNSGSFDLKYNGINYVNTLTMLTHAEKNEFNHSNNPTYVEKTQKDQFGALTSSGGYYEPDFLKIKNITNFPYENFSGSFVKQTYITKIAIYDDKKNVIAIAKLAKPVRKTEARNLTFKLKLDI